VILFGELSRRYCVPACVCEGEMKQGIRGGRKEINYSLYVRKTTAGIAQTVAGRLRAGPPRFDSRQRRRFFF
jgi:hypothetical protein